MRQPLPDLGYGLHCRVGADRDLAPARRVEQALVVERRMQLGRALHHHAAVVVVGRHLLALALLRHHVGARAGIGVEAGDAALLELVVLRRPGADEAALLLPEAVDALALDQRLDQAEGVVAGRQDDLHDLRIAGEHLAREALADVHAAAHAAAAARAGAGTELGGLEHAGVDAGIGELDGAGEPGIAAADDDHARRARHVDEIAGDRLVGLPPVGHRLEVLVEDVALAHRGSAYSSSMTSSAPWARLPGGAAMSRGAGAPRSARSGWRRPPPPSARSRS